MSTRNFEEVNFGLPLIVGGVHGEDEIEDQLECEDMEWSAEQINDQLEFYEVEVKGGYYVGAQYQVEYRDSVGQYLTTEEDIWYMQVQEFEDIFGDDCTIKQAIEKLRDELEDLERWLKEQKENGMIELACVGVFSNGEAVYNKVD